MKTLRNGLRVVAVPHDGPMASVWLWLQTGSADENPEHAGVAHFLEHLLFKGTERRGLGAASSEIEQAGGDLNAFTSWDHTVLHATVRGTRWETAVDVLSDMARGPLLDPTELVRERDVVLDEIRSYDEDVDSVVNDTLRAALWTGHPYGRPVLGVTDSVAPLDRDAVHAYWSKNWTSDRAILVVAGPVELAEVERVAERHLGSWAPGTGRAALAPTASVNSRAIRLDKRFETADVQIGWRAPAIDHPDLHAISLCAAALGQGSASTLAVELQLEAGLVGYAWASYGAAPGGGTFQLGFTPTEGETADAILAATEIVDRLRRGGLAGSRISRARDAMLAQRWFDHETVDGLAGDAAWFTAHYGSPDAAETHRRRLAALQPEDVYAAAERWLDPDRAILVAADPELKPKDLPNAWKKARTSRPVRTSDGPVTTTLDNGARIVVLPDRGKVAAIRLVTLGGGLTVPRRSAGMLAAWSDLVQSGAGPWDAIAFRQRTDALAAAIGATASPSTISLWSSFPASEFEDGLELVGEMFLDPHFDAEEWERVQQELSDELRTLADRPHDVAGRELGALMWRNHPWSLPFVGTSASVRRLTPRAMQRWHRQHIAPQRLVVAAAGGIDPDWATEVLSSWFGSLEAGPDLADRPTPKPPRRTVHRRTAGRGQATVMASLPTGAYDHPDRIPLVLGNTVLDGPSGRLFLDLRERRGLGYDVWSEFRVGVDGGVLTVGATCSPDRVDEAEAALRDQLKSFAEHGPTEAELDRVREVLDGDVANAQQRVSGRAAQLAFATLFDRPWKREELAAERAAVGPESVRDAFRRLNPEDPVVLVVRPK